MLSSPQPGRKSYDKADQLADCVVVADQKRKSSCSSCRGSEERDNSRAMDEQEVHLERLATQRKKRDSGTEKGGGGGGGSRAR